MLGPEDAAAFERTIADGGVALFPADTVYGLACDPEQPAAIERLATLKGRPAAKPSAVLFFSAEQLYAAVELEPRLRRAAEALLPGALTLLVPNPERRFPLACGGDPATLGVRLPVLPPAAASLAAVNRPVLQSSANLAGGPEARVLADVDAGLRAAADLVLDGSELPGTASTIVDLRGPEPVIVRQGAMPEAEVARRLRSPA